MVTNQLPPLGFWASRHSQKFRLSEEFCFDYGQITFDTCQSKKMSSGNYLKGCSFNGRSSIPYFVVKLALHNNKCYWQKKTTNNQNRNMISIRNVILYMILWIVNCTYACSSSIGNKKCLSSLILPLMWIRDDRFRTKPIIVHLLNWMKYEDTCQCLTWSVN